MQQGILAVDDFIMGKRQHEIFGEGVEKRERQFVVFVAAVNRVLREITERVVHPAHVPFQTESETTKIGWP